MIAVLVKKCWKIISATLFHCCVMFQCSKFYSMQCNFQNFMSLKNDILLS